ncbi:M1 family metallopeptidase [Candidatus Leptofilum sp.]|uniref:M1 family metallopeptidase n=1 Tax=Candidatus Leptofilum sp. TaxID=3241576 RepID=UPI003B5B8E71
MKMQALQAKVKKDNPQILKITQIFLILGFLLVGCGADDAATPTPIQVEAIPTIAATPTLFPEPTAVPPTPLNTTPDATAPLPFAGLSIGDPYAPELGNLGYDVLEYDLIMALDPAVENIDATVQIGGVITAPELAAIPLDFVGFEVTETLLDGQPVAFVHENDKLVILPARPLPENSPFDLSISYSGNPMERPSAYAGFASSLGMSFHNGESIYVLSEPDGSRFWFPNNDHPRDKATYRFEITVPAGLTAVANGLLIEQIDSETSSTFIWEHDFLMASYLATVVVGDFERVEELSPDGVLLRHYVTEAARDEFETAVADVGEAIDWMSERFGPYPYEAFGFVTADVSSVSLETQTMVLLANNMIGQRTVMHELAHMWFGNWVSLDSWQQMWRNEGFATYVQLMWETGDDPEALQLVIESFRSAVEENGDDFVLGNPPPAQLFSFKIYFGGAVFVHELRQEMGDEAFFSGLQDYFAIYGGGTASDDQFREVMEVAHGAPLDDFFAEWLKE